jgi:hypothetical protein
LFAAIALAALFCACTRTVRIELPPNEPITVVETRADYPSGKVHTKEISLHPRSPEYERLKRWIVNNQQGWSQSYATNPGTGIFVHSGDVHLQFINTAAFVFTANGQSQKEI